jgi:type VI secretion system protein ImpC
MPAGKLNDFARLIGRTSAAPQEASADELIRQIVAPHIVPAASPEQATMIAAVDEAISAAMRQILHHPDFQALESLWRSVDLLVRELETGPELQIVLYDVSAEDIAADLSWSDSLGETGLYKLLVKQPELDPRLGPLPVLVGNYGFELTPAHAELLARIGKIAAAAQAPFVAGVSTECLVKQDPNDVDLVAAEAWELLRQSPQVCYLGLAVPRFMLRWPYGAKTEPIDSFKFEEFTPQAGLKGMLWANSSILVGLLLAKTFSEQGLSGMQLGSVMLQGDIPFHYYTDEHGDQIALPGTERLVTESVAAHIASQNFMPVFSIRGRPEIRLGSFTSLAGADLAGPWAPVEVAYYEEEQYAAVEAPDSYYSDDAPSGEVADEAYYQAEEAADVAAEHAPDDDASAYEEPAEEREPAIDPELAALLEEL